MTDPSFLSQLLFWAVVEVTLTFLGLDDIANYSEFVFEKPIAVVSQVYAIE